MSRLLLFIPICLYFACITTKADVRRPGSLNGVWIPVKQEMNGKALPSPGYDRDTLTLNDTIYNYTSRDKGMINYKDGKMDIYSREGINAGKHFTAIYKVDHGQLVVCYNLDGDSYPADFETMSKQTLFLAVFRRSTE